MKSLLIALVLITSAPVFSQINMADSTAKIITYWDKDESQEYHVTFDNWKIENEDTTKHESISYDVTMKVLEATENRYTISWKYHNTQYHSSDTILKRIMEYSNNKEVIYETDELGTFLDVKNKEDIKNYMQRVVNELKKAYQHIPGMNAVLDGVESTYRSDAAITTSAIQDIHLFHTFHGAEYKLGNLYEAVLEGPNLYGEEPFDCHTTVYLDEINDEDNNVILRSEKTIDPNQLMDAAFQYMVKLMQTTGAEIPKRETFDGMTNNTYTASRIHTSGWVIYAINTIIVEAAGNKNVREMVIEIK
jgi:hypothetical protein